MNLPFKSLHKWIPIYLKEGGKCIKQSDVQGNSKNSDNSVGKENKFGNSRLLGQTWAFLLGVCF